MKILFLSLTILAAMAAPSTIPEKILAHCKKSQNAEECYRAEYRSIKHSNEAKKMSLGIDLVYEGCVFFESSCYQDGLKDFKTNPEPDFLASQPRVDASFAQERYYTEEVSRICKTPLTPTPIINTPSESSSYSSDFTSFSLGHPPSQDEPANLQQKDCLSSTMYLLKTRLESKSFRQLYQGCTEIADPQDVITCFQGGLYYLNRMTRDDSNPENLKTYYLGLAVHMCVPQQFKYFDNGARCARAIGF